MRLKVIKQINKIYDESRQEIGLRMLKCPKAWFLGYNFFNPKIYEENESWQKKQVKNWFTKYGKAHFKGLNIWDINWDA